MPINKTYCRSCSLPYTGNEGYAAWTCTPCLIDSATPCSQVPGPETPRHAALERLKNRRAAVRLKSRIARLFRTTILEAMEGLVTQEIVEHDVRIAPTEQEWVSDNAILEVACEGGILNSTDVECFHWEGREIVVRNEDLWDKITKTINERLEMDYACTPASPGKRLIQVHYEPYNSAIVGVYFANA